MRYTPLALVGVLASLPLLAQSQQRTPPRFEAGIEVINLTISVTDGRNQYITDLAERDFAVFEDGVRQDLSLFTHEDLPISMVLMVDTSSSMNEKLSQAQSAATRFIKTLRANDVAQLKQFNDRSTILQDFTSDQAALEAAVQRTEASGPTALYNALYVALKELATQKRAGELRRLAIIVLSDGEDTASLVNDEQVVELARKTEISIYAVSLRTTHGRDREPQYSAAEHFFTSLTRETGGRVYFPQSLSELTTVYARIAEELRTQYSLGYVSNNKRRDGKWRRIVVRVDKRDELHVRHKLGYYAPRS